MTAEKERQNSVVSPYKIGDIIKQQINTTDLLKQSADQFKQQMLSTEVGMVKQIKHELRAYIKLLPRDVHKQACNLELQLWKEKIY